MIEIDQPALVLSAADCWALVNGRDAAIAAAIGRLAVQYAAEQQYADALRPAAEVAAQLGISESALRARVRRGTWAGGQIDGRCYAVPPDSPLAPRSTP